MFYHDSRHPAIYMYEPPMEKEEFEAAVDEIVGTPVDALMYGLADGRTMFHDTKVSEVLGDTVKKWPHTDLPPGAPERSHDAGLRQGSSPHRL